MTGNLKKTISGILLFLLAAVGAVWVFVHFCGDCWKQFSWTLPGEKISEFLFSLLKGPVDAEYAGYFVMVTAGMFWFLILLLTVLLYGWFSREPGFMEQKMEKIEEDLPAEEEPPAV